jgi:hypothetical protein
MTEWLLLLVLVPAVVVPVVLLVGFAGCDKVFGLDHIGPRPPGPVILAATGKSIDTITLTWMIDPTATDIEFERFKLDANGPVGMPVTFTVAASPATHDDDNGLEAATWYRYTARAVLPDDTSEPSAPVDGATLGPPAFDAVANGTRVAANTKAITTWSHTASADASFVIVALRWQHNGSPFSAAGTPTRTATYGGTPMTSLGVIGLNNAALTDINGTFTYHEFFGLLAPPTGPQTVSLSVERADAVVTVDGCSVSYVRVSNFGSVSSVYGTEPGTSLAQTVSSATNEMVVQMFNTATGTISGYNQASRYDDQANGVGFVVGDAPGASSVPFAANRADATDYAGLAVRLNPVT